SKVLCTKGYVSSRYLCRRRKASLSILSGSTLETVGICTMPCKCFTKSSLSYCMTATLILCIGFYLPLCRTGSGYPRTRRRKAVLLLVLTTPILAHFPQVCNLFGRKRLAHTNRADVQIFGPILPNLHCQPPAFRVSWKRRCAPEQQRRPLGE